MLASIFYIAKIVLIVLFVKGATEALNNVELEGDKPYRDPVVTTLLCIFIPFYSIYWVYKMSKRIDLLLQERGVYDNVTLLYTVIAVFLDIVSFILMYLKLKDLGIETVKF